jgi:hypothetical protein
MLFFCLWQTQESPSVRRQKYSNVNKRAQWAAVKAPLDNLLHHAGLNRSPTAGICSMKSISLQAISGFCTVRKEEGIFGMI